MPRSPLLTHQLEHLVEGVQDSPPPVDVVGRLRDCLFFTLVGKRYSLLQDVDATTKQQDKCPLLRLGYLVRVGVERGVSVFCAAPAAF